MSLILYAFRRLRESNLGIHLYSFLSYLWIRCDLKRYNLNGFAMDLCDSLAGHLREDAYM